ncbi:beta-1,6-N-acetylglucosaminyltransferase [Lactobacillus delbrueckii]|uniref:beta-1,6-N-acetylglucosaminyltransferase n=1 Tax=Lactobacillus delbrueckii TaxID=1584 RepID=UPI001E3E591F|nr:beta-1,6-N-acetylglucosaminyltransferase [Lactobacillus delbrueckii]MCD5446670.1 hypothetical protein [Lactobacillus delbrueckii subsp. lactis]
MKHAFLITAHSNWEQLKALLKQIDFPDHDIYVHIDAKAKKYPKAELETVTQYSKVRIYSNFKVYWGGYTQTLAQLQLFKEAFNNGPYDYYHMMSGGIFSWSITKNSIYFLKRTRAKNL